MHDENKEVEIIIEDYSLGDMLENSSDLIRVEMNAVEYPLFSKNKKIKVNQVIKYNFDSNRYLEVKPVAGGKIPLEFDENIFYGLMRIYKKQSHSQKVYFDWQNLIEESGQKYCGFSLNKTKLALERMCQTTYIFNNLFYSNESKNIINDKLTTTMFSKREITLKDAQENSTEYLMYFRSGKVKEIVEVTFSTHFYENIIRKGYLYFDSKELFKIENAITRNIFMLLTKWRHGDEFIKRHSKYIAGRIPLSWKKENINKSVKSIERSMKELKEMYLIKDYNFVKTQYYESSYFQVFFDKKIHNRNYVKREETKQEQIDFKIENVQEAELVKETEIIKREVTKENFEKLIDSYLIENEQDMKDKIQRGIAKTILRQKYTIKGDN